MGANVVEVLRLAVGDQSVTVRVDPSPTYRDGSMSFYDARIEVRSGWIDAETRIDVAIGDGDNALDEWAELLDLFAAWEAGGIDDVERDWPLVGEAGYLRVKTDDPYSVSIHDGLGTTVNVRLSLAEDWIAESRERLGAARLALADAPALRNRSSEV